MSAPSVKRSCASVRSGLPVVQDPLIDQYVQSLGNRLVAASDDRGSGFTFFVVEDDSVNAFAAPGGFVGVNSGLILATRTESEFASVLAHEIAHVTQRHIARAFADAGRVNLSAMAGVAAAILIGARNVDAGQAAAAAVIGSTAQRRINFTRRSEREADRVGIRMLAGAGFDPGEMAGFFEKLLNASRYSRRPPEFLSTHPVTTDRIAEARDSAGRLPYKQHESSEYYRLVRARLRVRTAGDPQRVLDRLVEEHATDHARNAAANTYGQALALAMIRLGREDDGARCSRPPDRTAPGQPGVPGRTRRQRAPHGEPVAGALALYSEGLDLHPDDRLLLRGYAAALNGAGRPQDTLRLIDEHGRLHTLDAEMYRLRAEAYEKLGRTIDSRMDLAEHYYLSGRLDSAISPASSGGSDPGSEFLPRGTNRSAPRCTGGGTTGAPENGALRRRRHRTRMRFSNGKCGMLAWLSGSPARSCATQPGRHEDHRNGEGRHVERRDPGGRAPGSGRRSTPPMPEAGGDPARYAPIIGHFRTAAIEKPTGGATTAPSPALTLVIIYLRAERLGPDADPARAEIGSFVAQWRHASTASTESRPAQ